MARGDFIRITYRTPVGAETATVTAQKDGAKVVVINPDPRPAETYLRVEEQNRNGATEREFLFAKGEVLALERGQMKVARKRAPK